MPPKTNAAAHPCQDGTAAYTNTTILDYNTKTKSKTTFRAYVAEALADLHGVSLSETGIVFANDLPDEKMIAIGKRLHALNTATSVEIRFVLGHWVNQFTGYGKKTEAIAQAFSKADAENLLSYGRVVSAWANVERPAPEDIPTGRTLPWAFFKETAYRCSDEERRSYLKRRLAGNLTIERIREDKRKKCGDNTITPVARARQLLNEYFKQGDRAIHNLITWLEHQKEKTSEDEYEISEPGDEEILYSKNPIVTTLSAGEEPGDGPRLLTAKPLVDASGLVQPCHIFTCEQDLDPILNEEARRFELDWYASEDIFIPKGSFIRTYVTSRFAETLDAGLKKLSPTDAIDTKQPVLLDVPAEPTPANHYEPFARPLDSPPQPYDPITLTASEEQKERAKKIAEARTRGHDGKRSREEERSDNFQTDYRGALAEVCVIDHLRASGLNPEGWTDVANHAPNGCDFILDGTRFDIKSIRFASRYATANLKQHERRKTDFYVFVVFTRPDQMALYSPIPWQEVDCWETRRDTNAPYKSSHADCLRPLTTLQDLLDCEPGRAEFLMTHQ